MVVVWSCVCVRLVAACSLAAWAGDWFLDGIILANLNQFGTNSYPLAQESKRTGEARVEDEIEGRSWRSFSLSTSLRSTQIVTAGYYENYLWNIGRLI